MRKNETGSDKTILFEPVDLAQDGTVRDCNRDPFHTDSLDRKL